MRVEMLGLTLMVSCKCGRRMIFSIEGYTCLGRTRWNFLWHDKTIQYADARKIMDRR